MSEHPSGRVGVPGTGPSRFTGVPRLVAFDLDDTLAPSKSPLEERMSTLLERLLEVAEVCVISGGSFAQFRDQLISRLSVDAALDRLHLMPTCGTQYYRWDGGSWARQYAEDLTEAEKRSAFAAIEEEARRLELWETETCGPAIEDRGSQITYSALGQRAPVAVKAAWDPTGVRKSILRSAVQERLPGLEVRSGGSTSLDVTRHGVDKAYGMTRLAQLTGIPFGSMLFVGDRLDPDGNDYPVLRLGIGAEAVHGWEQTADIVEDVLRAAAH